MENKRLTTSEDYKRRIDAIVNYVREHLDSVIDLSTLAELSAFSPFHFHRITKAYLGEPIGAFIVRTRAETAAKLLRYSDMDISDIAYKVGYDTPSSLSKSFVKIFGVSPSNYRKTNNYYRMTQVAAKQEVNLSRAKVVELELKTVLFISATGMYEPAVFESSFQQMWAEVKRQGIYSAGIEHIGLYYNNPKITEDEKIKYDVCLRVCKVAEPNGNIGVKEIAGGKYVMFANIGEYTKIGAAYDKIYGELLALGGFELRGNFCFEKYVSDPRKVAPEKLKTEIYIPIM